jgi:hypothetical protein
VYASGGPASIAADTCSARESASETTRCTDPSL